MYYLGHFNEYHPRIHPTPIHSSTWFKHSIAIESISCHVTVWMVLRGRRCATPLELNGSAMAPRLSPKRGCKDSTLSHSKNLDQAPLLQLQSCQGGMTTESGHMTRSQVSIWESTRKQMGIFMLCSATYHEQVSWSQTGRNARVRMRKPHSHAVNPWIPLGPSWRVQCGSCAVFT